PCVGVPVMRRSQISTLLPYTTLFRSRDHLRRRPGAAPDRHAREVEDTQACEADRMDALRNQGDGAMTAQDLVEKIAKELEEVKATEGIMQKDLTHEMAKRAIMSTLAWVEQRSQPTHTEGTTDA